MWKLKLYHPVTFHNKTDMNVSTSNYLALHKKKEMKKKKKLNERNWVKKFLFVNITYFADLFKCIQYVYLRLRSDYDTFSTSL